MLYLKDWDEITHYLDDSSIPFKEKRISVNSITSNGESTLLWASKVAPFHIIEKLLEVGDTEVLLKQDVNGMSPLHCACLYSTPEVIELLIQVGGKDLVLKQDVDGWTALHIACRYSESMRNPINKLIDVGEKQLVKKRDKYGNTALHLLCEDSKPPLDIIEKMVSVGGRSLLSKRNDKDRLAIDSIIENTDLSDDLKGQYMQSLKVKGEMIVVSDLVPIHDDNIQDNRSSPVAQGTDMLELLQLKETSKTQSSLIEELKAQNEILMRQNEKLKKQNEELQLSAQLYRNEIEEEKNVKSEKDGKSVLDEQEKIQILMNEQFQELKSSHQDLTRQLNSELNNLKTQISDQHGDVVERLQNLEHLFLQRRENNLPESCSESAVDKGTIPNDSVMQELDHDEN